VKVEYWENMPKLESFEVKLPLGPFSAGGKWVPDTSEAEAAWELYVELITRVTIVDLKEDEGLLREALTSLYSLFDTTREILRTKGPNVARPKKGGDYSFGYIAVTVLNFAVRPVLAKWHPELQNWEAVKAADKTLQQHEAEWARSHELRDELGRLRAVLREYADLLAKVAGVPNLLSE
jgi:hypothetical protein